MLNSHAYKITWNWNKQLLGASIDVKGKGGAQKKNKTGHTHTVQLSRWSRHHSTVFILLSRELDFLGAVITDENICTIIRLMLSIG